jgi:hypothetical protein
MPPLRTAEALHRQGSRAIRPGPQNALQIREWLRAADEKMKDALNATVSKGTRMDAAYDVVLCCGLAVLSTQGWRAGSEPGHHAEVLEAMGAALGLKQAQFDELDAVRGWRHRKYRGALTPEDAECSLNREERPRPDAYQDVGVRPLLPWQALARRHQRGEGVAQEARCRAWAVPHGTHR